MKPVDPETPEQWQEAVDCAEACLLIDAARQYGLITGGPAVNVERCVQIKAHGYRRGVSPRQVAVDRFINEICRGGKQ